MSTTNDQDGGCQTPNWLWLSSFCWSMAYLLSFWGILQASLTLCCPIIAKIGKALNAIGKTYDLKWNNFTGVLNYWVFAECLSSDKFSFTQQGKCLTHMAFKTTDHRRLCVHTCLLINEPGHIMNCWEGSLELISSCMWRAWFRLVAWRAAF